MVGTGTIRGDRTTVFGLLVVEGRPPFPLTHATTTLGRAPENDLVLDDPSVSRFHARLVADDTGVRLVDLGSANGTRIDGRELEPKVDQQLDDGAHIVLGPFHVRYRDAAHAEAAAHAPAPATTVVGRPATLVIATQAGTCEVPLPSTALTLGRSPDNDVVVDAEAVSRHHARIEPIAGGHELVDLGSTNGLAVGGRRVERVSLSPDVVVAIGRTVTLAYRPGVTAPAPAAPRPRVLPLPERGEVSIGRSSDADVSLAHPRVSTHHARIARRDEGYLLEDLGSTTGTFVNGERIDEHVLADGDVVRIGSHRLVVSEGRLEMIDEAGGLRLDARRLTMVVEKTKRILDDVSLSISPQEFVAIVGVSGSGKSTLLNALCGFRPATTGSVFLGATDLYRHFDAYRDELGYVPQDDIIHRELPVGRALDYAARLRLPRDTGAAQRRERIGEVLRDLDLVGVADSTVNHLSGGQRKRVSIGVELLTRPSLFFLDEATSGLDPGTESQMMKLLRHLADQGRTVVLVTHATKNVMMCDKVVFLARGGRLAYYGPPEEALTYFGVADFDEIYTKLEGRDPIAWAADFRASPQYAEHVAARLARPPESEEASPLPATTGDDRRPAPRPTRRGSSVKQFFVLCRRYLDTIARDRKTAILLLSLAPILGVLDLVAWDRELFDPVEGSASQAVTMFFMTSLITILVGTITSVRELVKEEAIYRRESMVGLRVAPYVASKVAIGFLFAVYSAVVLWGFQVVTFGLGDLGVARLGMLLVPIVIGTFAGVAWGLLVSALAPSEERAMLLVILVLVPQFVFSGGMVPVKDLGPAGEVLGYVTSSRWELGAMVTAAELKSGDCTAPGLSDCSMPGLDALASVPEKQALIQQLTDQYGDIFAVDVYVYWIAGLGLVALLIVVTTLLQRRKGRV